VGESGFGWHSTAREVCSSLGKRLDGKLVVVTGANSGVGLEAAKSFYEIGATVILACRSEQRAAAAKKLIEDTAVISGQPGSLAFVALDLGSLQSVEAFADRVNVMPEPLYALVCNGGIMATPFKLTEDGLEQQFQVNYLSHYHLTMLLLDKLKATGQSRIVNVSSVSHAWLPFPGGCCGGCCSLCFGGFDLGKRYPAKHGGCFEYEPFEDYSYSARFSPYPAVSP
jgi:NAD(P)-dependent dehydrogenase (short-subunit alcohol dehydrogenase family)